MSTSKNWFLLLFILYHLLSTKWEGEQRTRKLLLFKKRWSLWWWWLYIHTWWVYTCNTIIIRDEEKMESVWITVDFWFGIQKNSHIYLVPLTRNSQNYFTIRPSPPPPSVLTFSTEMGWRRAMGWWRHNKHTLTPSSSILAMYSLFSFCTHSGSLLLFLCHHCCHHCGMWSTTCYSRAYLYRM